MAGADAPRDLERPSLDRPVGASGLPGATTLRRVGPRLGIGTVRQLLSHFPRHYEDLRRITPLGELVDLPPGTAVTVRATVDSIGVERTFRRGIQRTTAILRDPSGEVTAVWFGRRYIERQLKAGDRIVASGKAKPRGWQVQLDNPDFQRDDGGDLLHAGRIVPVYRLTHGLSARTLRTAVRAGLDRYGPYREYLPDDLLAGRPAIGDAFEAAHFPADFEQRDAAVLRLAHDELLALQVGMVARRRQRRDERRGGVEVDDATDATLRASIRDGLAQRVGREVELTPDQLAAMAAIRDDLRSSVPMLRLIQGDVGSGKTAVAAHALGLAARAGGQAALLAPTDLLARQLAATVADLLAAAGIPVASLTGSMGAAARRASHEAMASGQAQVVVGTHALIAEAVAFARLDLVVIDEQHRFGVAQREALAAKGQSPHVLLMTATPIPRTLGQVLYADLDVSDLRSAPDGRPHVATGIRRASDLEGTWAKVASEAAAGHRTFVVVPTIDPQGSDEDDDAPAAPTLPPDRARGLAAATGVEEVAERLRTQLAPLRVGLVHGRLRADDRDAEMDRFRKGELDVLVGTSVVEVGVDVPEATMMVILDADHFGLSQLHQLRGRVGRGRDASFCVLVADVPEESVAWSRLTTVAATRDGFVLAEKDWQLRGEGDVLGLSQSGLPRLRMAALTLEEHRRLAVECRAAAERLLDERGRLRADLAPLAAELESGWLADIARGEAAAEEGIGA